MSVFGLPIKKSSMWDQETQTKEKTDWTHFLAPESVSILRRVLEKAYRHREAYFRADNIPAAQVWSAFIEMQKEIDMLNAKIEHMTPKQVNIHRVDKPMPYEGSIFQKINNLMKPKPQDSKEATDALINSLMKF